MTRSVFCFLATTFLVVTAHAQVRSPDIVSQILTPGPQTAATDDAWSLFTNPAGISFIDGAQLVGAYAHMWRQGASGLHQGQAAVGFNIFDGLALGLGAHLALPSDPNLPQNPNQPNDNGQIDGTLSLAYRYHRAFAIGLSTYKQRRYALTDSDPFIFNFGLQGYPTSWLALGVVASQVYGNFGSPLEFRFGAAFRPFGEAFSLSADVRIWPTQDSWQQPFSIDPQLAARVDVGGFSLFANAIVQDVARGFQAPIVLVGLEFNFEHFGVSALGGGQVPRDRGYVGGRFRVSSEAWPTLVPQKRRWLSFTLTGEGTLARRYASLTERLLSPQMPSVAVLQRLSQIADDPGVEGVVLRLDNLDFEFARAHELHDVIVSLRNSGKKVVVYFDAASAVEYYVASAADRIYLSPGGEIDLDRFRTSLVYFKKGLADLGVSAEAVTAGLYKNAVKPFTANEPSPQELEVTNAILNESYGQFTDAIANRIQASSSKAASHIDLGSVVATEALEMKLVDGLAYQNQIPELLERQFGGRVTLSDNYFSRKKKQLAWGNLPKIVVIPIAGTIVQGRVHPGILSELFPRVGSDDVVDSLEQASQDPSIYAIVLRIESPGGDALASDLIYHAVREARKRKPVIASLGDVAASGGYYIAAGAHEIWAQPSTLTGSIGVFSLHFSGQKLAQKLGVSSHEIAKGKLPGPTLLRPFTPQEKKRSQNIVDWHYEQFKNAVKSGHDLNDDEINKAADGRVWTGKQAIDLKLVDKLGGFTQAFVQAKRAAGLGENDPVNMVVVSYASASPFGITSFVTTFASSYASYATQTEKVLLPLLELQDKPLAMMPFWVLKPD